MCKNNFLLPFTVSIKILRINAQQFFGLDKPWNDKMFSFSLSCAYLSSQATHSSPSGVNISKAVCKLRYSTMLTNQCVCTFNTETHTYKPCACLSVVREGMSVPIGSYDTRTFLFFTMTCESILCLRYWPNTHITQTHRIFIWFLSKQQFNNKPQHDSYFTNDNIWYFHLWSELVLYGFVSLVLRNESCFTLMYSPLLDTLKNSPLPTHRPLVNYLYCKFSYLNAVSVYKINTNYCIDFAY